MPKWLIRLKGEKFDLEDLPDLLRSPELNVREDNGSYYLQSSEFDSLNLPDEVRERGIALIKLINGAAKLYRDNFHDIAEDGVTFVGDDGKRRRNVYLEEKLTARAKTSATVVKSDGTERPIDQPIPLESILLAAKKDKSVADALRFYREDTWINLYKVYEVIRDDVDVEGHDQIINKGWATKADLSRFKQTAQSRAALGDYARHASEKYKPPADPMSLADAKSLIKSIFINWLRAKKNNYHFYVRAFA